METNLVTGLGLLSKVAATILCTAESKMLCLLAKSKVGSCLPLFPTLLVASENDNLFTSFVHCILSIVSLRAINSLLCSII